MKWVQIDLITGAYRQFQLNEKQIDKLLQDYEHDTICKLVDSEGNEHNIKMAHVVDVQILKEDKDKKKR